MSKWSPCWQNVTCADCHIFYTCIPQQDYYNSTNNHDGVCGSCLMRRERETVLSSDYPIG